MERGHIHLTPGIAGQVYLYGDGAETGCAPRFVVTLTMCVDKHLLERAVNEVMPRFSQFAAGLSLDEDGYTMVQLSSAVPVFEAGAGCPELMLGCSGLGGYLFMVSFLHKSIYFDYHRALCDEKGMSEFIKSVLFRYVRLCGYLVTNDGSVKEVEDGYHAIEGADPYTRIEDIPASRPVWYMEAKAFSIPHVSVPDPCDNVMQIRIPLSKVKTSLKPYMSAPETFISPLFSHAVYERYSEDMGQGEFIVASIMENLRPHFPTASLRPFYAPVNLAYNRKLTEYPFNTILMSQRKLLDAQLRSDALAYSSKRMIDGISKACDPALSFDDRIRKVGELVAGTSSMTTFSICNLGSPLMPESLQQYITEFYTVIPAASHVYSLSMISFRGDLIVTIDSRGGDRGVPLRFMELLNEYDIYAFIADEFRFIRQRYQPKQL